MNRWMAIFLAAGLPAFGQDPSVKRDVDRARASLAEAEKHAEKALKDKDLDSFDRAKRSLASAWKRLNDLQTSYAKKDAEVAKLAEEFGRRYRGVYQSSETFLAEAVKDVAAPEDAYEGSDREELRKSIADAWKARWPEDKVLAIRFHMKKWDRTVKKKDGELIDKSVLEVSVVVKQTERIATIYPAYLNRDNLSGTIEPGVSTKFGGFVTKEVLCARF